VRDKPPRPEPTDTGEDDRDAGAPPGGSAWLREELLQLLGMAGNMAGLSITGVTLFYTVGRHSRAATIADDLLAACALLFLLCAYLIMIALRTRGRPLALRLERAADALFVVGMTLMVATGLVMAYTVW
jgi:hypothetical protein